MRKEYGAITLPSARGSRGLWFKFSHMNLPLNRDNEKQSEKYAHQSNSVHIIFSGCFVLMWAITLYLGRWWKWRRVGCLRITNLAKMLRRFPKCSSGGRSRTALLLAFRILGCSQLQQGEASAVLLNFYFYKEVPCRFFFQNASVLLFYLFILFGSGRVLSALITPHLTDQMIPRDSFFVLWVCLRHGLVDHRLQAGLITAESH